MDNLAFDFSYTPPKEPVQTSPSAPQSRQCEGYCNWATYGAAQILSNDFESYKQFETLYQVGQLNSQAIARRFKVMRIRLGEWMTGEIDWEEILEYYNESFGYKGNSPAATLSAVLPENPKIPLEVLIILSRVQIEENVARLTCGTLDRNLYQQVSKVMETLGGKWNRKLDGFLFKNDPTEALDMVLTTGSVEKPDNFGFFHTQPVLAEPVVVLAQIEDGMEVLEPSAGQGGLADFIIRYTGKEKVFCYELQLENVSILKGKGYCAQQANFMDVVPAQQYDVVVMNPPFSKQQDIKHVLHAWKFLRPGGRLVAIMSSGPTFRQDRLSETFRTMVQEHGWYEENPEGSFKASGTSVNTITVVMDKPIH